MQKFCKIKHATTHTCIFQGTSSVYLRLCDMVLTGRHLKVIFSQTHTNNRIGQEMLLHGLYEKKKDTGMGFSRYAWRHITARRHMTAYIVNTFTGDTSLYVQHSNGNKTVNTRRIAATSVPYQPSEWPAWDLAEIPESSIVLVVQHSSSLRCSVHTSHLPVACAQTITFLGICSHINTKQWCVCLKFKLKNTRIIRFCCVYTLLRLLHYLTSYVVRTQRDISFIDTFIIISFIVSWHTCSSYNISCNTFHIL